MIDRMGPPRRSGVTPRRTRWNASGAIRTARPTEALSEFKEIHGFHGRHDIPLIGEQPEDLSNPFEVVDDLRHDVPQSMGNASDLEPP